LEKAITSSGAKGDLGLSPSDNLLIYPESDKNVLQLQIKLFPTFLISTAEKQKLIKKGDLTIIDLI
jgi:hypothetical protein